MSDFLEVAKDGETKSCLPFPGFSRDDDNSGIYDLVGDFIQGREFCVAWVVKFLSHLPFSLFWRKKKQQPRIKLYNNVAL